jgi:aryl-alcohol dehydrogenase-like predicted oxidoreductase
MKYRPLGRTGWEISSVGFGAWAIGGNWGHVSDQDALEALETSLENGVNFIDTADVYGDGRSEQLIARFLADRSERVYVATKAGQALVPHEASGYNLGNLTAFVDKSLSNLRVEALDLLQLHCPPTEVYDRREVFDALDSLVKDGKVRFYGVSVEKVEEALKAIEYSDVQSVQIIFNIFRQRPAEQFFKKAQEKGVGVLARVPLASGLLTGKMREGTVFPTDDHRNFNRHGEAFDVGETFSGVDFGAGLAAVERLRQLVPDEMTMGQFALRWILMFSEVSSVIPGAKNRLQAEENSLASDLAAVTETQMRGVEGIYNELIREHVHHKW